MKRIITDEQIRRIDHFADLAEHMTSNSGIKSPYLDVDEAALYCRLARQTLYNHRSEIERQPGIGKLLFTREALDRWLATRNRRR